MDDSAYSDSFGKKYSVDLSFEMKPFYTYPVASFNDVNVAYKWLLDLHNLLLCEHILQITDSDGDVVFNLSHQFEFDDGPMNGRFDTTKIWFFRPGELDVVEQLDLPF